MRKTQIHFVENLKKYLIVSIALIVVGVVIAVIFGVNMDINFKGGTRFTYTYSGEINLDEVQSLAGEKLGKQVTVAESTDIAGTSSKLIITLVGDQSVTAETQQALTDGLAEAYPDNAVKLGDSNTVSPTIARSFFAKSLFAVALAGLLVVIYVGLRFRKIGGISAGLMALVALVHDCLLAFVTCVIFRLQIDANFMAVILTIFGYSLNNTIVIYDRVRENKRLHANMKVAELVNNSVNETMGRSLFTTVTTFIAVVTVAIVAEVCGMTTLRSFAIPMAVGLVAGCYSSMCLSGPLWVRWIWHKEKHPKKKKTSKK
ncbi:MAG: protein translocase subunit SecF [Clostridiales bacterium]|nr:protein translocase subunit SecF [Clostridiales bacterium]